LVLALLPALAAAQAPLGSGELQILGARLTVLPATQTVPRNQATGLATALVDPTNPATSLSVLGLDGLLVKGEFSGPGIGRTEDGSGEARVTISTPVGQLLPIPPLLLAGNYVVDNLRLEDPTGNFILPGEPAVATITVIDKVIVTSVSSRPLSLDEIQERGIVIDSSNFSAFEFTFGIGTESNPVPISFDVAFPQDKDLVADEGGLTLPPVIPSLDVPNLEVKGLMLESPPFDDESIHIPPIPAVIVIPGNIAFLHQFFQVLVLVSNVAPAGSRLVVTSASATMVLPAGADGIADSADDPLVPARTTGGAGRKADIRNKSSGAPGFGPGEDASGELAVEAKLEGTYRIEVNIIAQLLGLPVGPVPLSGKAFGTVVVRNPSFALTFNHPDVVRAGETYSLFVAIHNTGDADANCVTLSLQPQAISGATLVAAGAGGPPALPASGCPVGDAVGTVVVPTIRRNDATTVEFKLIARKNGQVTATGFTSADPLNASFVLRTGIGDRGIPLSPESLVLAPYVNDLPSDFFQTALRVLGLAHSVATAPQGAPLGINNRIGRDVVEQRAGQLTEAGLRIRIGDTPVTSIGDLMLDWLGNGGPQAGTPAPPGSGFDAGFDEIMRTSDAGHDLENAWAGVITADCGLRNADCGVVGLQQQFAHAEQYRPTFVSVAASNGATISIADDQGRRSAGVDSQQSMVERDIPGTVILGFTSGELAVVGRSAASAYYDVTFTGTGSGVADLAIVAADGSGALRELVYSNVALSAGEPATLRIVPGAAAPPLLILPNSQQLTPNTLLQFDANAGPRIIGARQIPESDPLMRGRVVAVLYDRTVDPESLSAGGFGLAYTGGQGALAQGVTQNRVKRVHLLPSQRIALVNFLASVSRFFDYELSSSGATAPVSHAPQVPEPDTRRAVPDFSTPSGGVVSGFVRKGTGQPIAFAPVELREQFLDDVFGFEIEIVTAQSAADASGYYRFDFVAHDDIGPSSVTAQDPDTGQRARRFARIAQEHQEMRVDLLMQGLGRVAGTVIDAMTGLPVANAAVTVQSRTDPAERQVRSSGDGSFSADNVVVGNVLVSADVRDPNTDVARSGSVAANVESAGATTTVEVLLFSDTGAIEGTVYEEAVSDQLSAISGLVPAGSGVEVAVYDDAQDFERDTQTDRSGHFILTGVKPGPLRVRAIRAETSEQVELQVNVGPGVATPVNIIFSGTATIVGRVIYPDGRPATDVAVIAGTTLVRSDSNGGFAIERVGTGQQAIHAVNESSGAEAFVEVDIGAPGMTVPVTVVLPGSGVVRGILRNAAGVIQAGVEVFLWFGNGGFLRSTTASSGEFVFRYLPLRSDYTLRASNAAGDGQIRTVSLVSNGQTVTSDLTLRGLGTVTGVVLAADGVSPRTAQVTVSYTAFDPIGQPKQFTQTITSDQLVTPAGPGTTSCNARCADGTTNCSGRFTLQLPIGFDYRVQVQSLFAGDTPEPAAASGVLQTAGEIREHCLTLGASGRVTGTVFLADGRQTDHPVEVTYSEARTTGNPNVRAVTTDDNGQFMFDLLPLRPFVITALDRNTGSRGVVRGSVLTGDETQVAVNLLGQGTVTVHVVDGAGAAIPNARVTLTSGSPVAFLLNEFPTLVTSEGGVVEYAGVPEGEFGVTAEDPSSLSGGRSGGAIVEDQGHSEVTIALAPSGTVTGVLFDATGSATLPFAQVRLLQTGRAGAYATSDENGVYTFEFVPLGSCTLEFVDPRSGRIGLGGATVDYATEVVTADLFLLPVGTVSGSVRRPAGSVVSGAQVELTSSLLVRPAALSRDLSFFGPGKLTTTSNLDGAYSIGGVPQGDFSVQGTERDVGGDVRASGVATGRLTSEGETVALDVSLEGRGRVSGTTLRADGVTPVGFATVTLETASARLSVVADAQGRFEFTSVTLGAYAITAHAQGGSDGGSAAGSLDADGDTNVTDIVFNGTGMIAGQVVDALGQAVTTPVQLTLVRRDLGATGASSVLQTSFLVFSDPTGRFSFSDIPTGSFTVTATLVTSGLAGNASAILARDGQSLDDLEITIEPAAGVGGAVVLSDGVSPAANALVTLTGVSDRTGKQFTLSTTADGDGEYRISDLPLGTFSINAFDFQSRGTGVASGRLDVAGATVAVDAIVLDDRVPGIVGVSPANGAARVSLDTPLLLSFSEEIDAATVTADSIIVRAGSTVLAGTRSISAGRTVVTFTPVNAWPELSTLSVEVNQKVRDELGRPLTAVFRSSFQTADVTPPRVLTGNLALGQVVLQFSEAVRVDSGSVTLLEEPVTSASVPIAGTMSYSNGNRTVIFKPNVLLPDDRSFRLIVTGWRDLFGTVQALDFSADVATTDHSGPDITLSSSVANDTAVVGENVTLTAPPAVGVADVQIVDFLAADGQLLSSDNTPPFTHSFVANGTTTLTAVATDFSGNRGAPVSITIAAIANAAPTVQLTAPASGVTVGTGGSVMVSATATDDLALAEVQLMVRGTELTSTQVYRFAAGVRSATASFVVPIPAAAQPDANLVLAVVARDVRGLASAASSVTVHVVDATMPAARITSLLGSFVANPATTIPVTVQTDDAVGVTRIRMRTEGGVVVAQDVEVVPPAKTTSATFALVIPADAPEGSTITLIAEALDAAGNVGSAPRIMLTVRDGTPPTVAIVSPLAGTQQIAGGAVPVVAQATDNGAIFAVDFFVDGALVASDRTADAGGIYRATLVTVRTATSTVFGARAVDAQGNVSSLATVTLPLRPNQPPNADAGGDRTALTGAVTTLSGVASSDPDGSGVTYRWRLISKPGGSAASLSSATFRDATLRPDIAGVYLVGLIVNDGIDDSTEDVVAVNAVVATATPTATVTSTPTITPTPAPTVSGSEVFPPAPGVLAQFEFNGDTLDSSGNRRDATLLGGQFVTTAFGQGLHVSAGGPTGIDWSQFAGLLVHPYTIEMVVRPVDTTSYRKLFSFSDSTDAGWYYHSQGFQAYPNGVVGGGQVAAGNRHYLAIVSTASNQLSVYFQGVLLGTTNAGFSAPPAQAIFFRDDAASGRAEQLDAVVDALRISGVTRTSAEIAAMQDRLQTLDAPPTATAAPTATATRTPTGTATPLPTATPTSTFLPCAAKIASFGPIAWWRFGEASGFTAVDSSGYGMNGDYQASPSQDHDPSAPALGAAGAVSGDPNTAVSFGGGSQMSVFTNTDAASVSLAAFIKTSSTARMSIMVRMDSFFTGVQPWRLEMSGGRLYLYVNYGATTGSIATAAGANYADANYHHVVGTYDGPSGVAKLYVDGAEVQSATLGLGNLIGVSPRGRDVIGNASYASSNFPFTGTIDEPQVYANALSAAQVLDEYTTCTSGGALAGASAGELPSALDGVRH
jgi:hypothetical protein